MKTANNTLVVIPNPRFLRVRDLLFLLFILCLALPVSAQVQTGTPPFGSFGGGPDIIDLANLNAHWTIPVIHKPGRGLNFTYDLSYDSSVWYPSSVNGTNTWTPVQNWGWRGQTEAEVGYVSYKAHRQRCPILGDGFFTTYDTYVYHDSFGVGHAYVGTSEIDCNGIFTGFTETAADGSGYTINVTDVGSETVTSSAGKFINPSGTTGNNSIDRNGNQITVDTSGHFYDTLSTSVAALTVSGTAPTSTTFSYSPPSGTGSVTYTMSYVYYTVATNFGISTIAESGASAVYLVDKVTLPDGTFYQFSYEATPSTPSAHACTPLTGTYSTNCVTARVAKVTLPTGGYISYSYTGGAGTNNSGIFTDGSAATIARVVNDGTSSNTWNYTRTQNTGAASTIIVADPPGNQTKIQFQGIYETERQSYQGTTSGTLLSTVDTCYNGATIPCTGTAVTPSITQRAAQTTLPSSGAATLISKTVSSYNTAGVPTEVDRYAFGSGAVGGIVNKTLVSYAPLQNITAFRQQITVENSSGTVIAQTNYNYDETTPTSAPAGTPQLMSVTASRGNLTSVQRCNNLSSCSSSPKSIMTYDTAGQVLTAKDPIGNQTTFSYADNFFDDNGANPPAAHATLGYPTDAFPTSITSPIIGAATVGYYFYSGQTAFARDQNYTSSNDTGSYLHFDSLGRPSTSYGPSLPIAGGSGTAKPWASTQYTSSTQVDTFRDINDSSLTPLSACPATTSHCRQDRVNVDGLGRVLTQQLVSDPDGVTKVDTAYDVRGQVFSVSHAYRSQSDPTYGLEKPSYDALGRSIKVLHPDNTFSQTLYGANVTGTGVNTSQLCSSSTYGLGFPILSIDESSRMREIWVDALGRTIEGDEPDSSSHLTSYVCYSYDPLGNLVGVVRSGSPSQTRSYLYDPLSRVTSVTIPERANSSGINCAVTFTYDANSNTQTKTIPGPNQNTSCTSSAVTITYSYDGLNRPTGKTYSDNSPTVKYFYDGTATFTGCPTSTTPPSLSDSNPKGRMTAMCDSSGATSWAHDAAGRTIQETRKIIGTGGAIAQTISYVYNLDGSIASIAYPSTKQVAYTVGNAQRRTAAKDPATGGPQFALMASYAPMGVPSSTVIGQVSGGFGGVTESHSFNQSLEYTRTQATSTAGTAMDLSFNFATSSDNGTITSITNNTDTNRTQTFLYDPLNRITSALSQGTSGADCWGQTFVPDALANLNTINNAQCSSGSLSVNVDANNHITGTSFSYDAGGNMLGDGQSGVTYSFDDENRMIKATPSGGPYCYVYDGNGLRVAKLQGGTGGNCSGGTYTKLYWRSLSGDSLAETDGSGSTSNSAYTEYVFFAGRRIASRTGTGSVFYFFADQVGTIRTVTTGSGTGQTPGQLCYDADFTPYGQEMQHTERLQTTACPPNYRFTGYEWDSETQLNYAFARYYSPRLGRFLSTDLLSGAISDLQSHNAYAYTRNNPGNRMDPSGMVDCHPEEGCWALPDGNGGGIGDDPGIFVGNNLSGGGLPLFFGPNNPGNGFDFNDTTNGAASEDERQIRQDILMLNRFAFTAARAFFQAITDYNQSVAEEIAYFQSAAYKAAIEEQKVALATAIAANSGGTITYQQAYDSLNAEDGYLKGGNYNFVSQYDAGDLTCGADSDRCNGIHFSGQDGNGNFYVHLDTSNPFAGDVASFAEHSFVDVFLGNFFFYVIPRPRP